LVPIPKCSCPHPALDHTYRSPHKLADTPKREIERDHKKRGGKDNAERTPSAARDKYTFDYEKRIYQKGVKVKKGGKKICERFPASLPPYAGRGHPVSLCVKKMLNISVFPLPVIKNPEKEGHRSAQK